jgi:hypothetical protein
VDVGAADAAQIDAGDDMAGPGIGQGCGLDGELAERPMQQGGFAGFRHPIDPFFVSGR